MIDQKIQNRIQGMHPLVQLVWAVKFTVCVCWSLSAAWKSVRMGDRSTRNKQLIEPRPIHLLKNILIAY
jgi:hypothetical protein